MQTTIRNTLSGAMILSTCAGLAIMPAQAAPRIVGKASAECRDTLVAANTAFYSKAFRLDDAITLPRGAPVQVVAQRLPGNLSGVDGVAADAAIFKTLPPPRAKGPNMRDIRALYRQITPTLGVRWVIADEPFNADSDFYDLFAVDAATTETDFTPSEDDKESRAILTNALMPPLMLRDERSGEVWAAFTDDGDMPGTWQVYAAGKDGVKERCTIAFGPRVKTAFDLLPSPVRTLAIDLDGTIGDGRNEGTIHQTPRIRGEVAQAWADTVLRPWAVTTKPYNSRRDVDAGLHQWSKGVASFRTLDRRIQAEYSTAIDALADLYVQRFGKTPEAARTLARHNLDIAYRSHFVFPQAFIHPAPKDKPAA